MISPGVLSHLAMLHARNSDTEARLPRLLMANLSSYPPDDSKGRQSSAKAGSVPASAIQGAEPDLPLGGSIVNGLPVDLPPVMPETPTLPPSGGGGPAVDITSAYNNPSVSVTPEPSSFDAPPAQPVQGPAFDVNPKNFLPPTPSRPSPLPTILGIGGGIAGTVLGGPIGGALGKFGGSLLGRLIASGALGNLNLPARGPDGIGTPQQSGSIMDRNRGGIDPNTQLFTNGIRPYGPGRIGSDGYYGAGMAQADQLAQAALQARMVEGGDRGELNTTLPPNFPGFQTPGGLLPAGLPAFAPAPLPGNGNAALLALLLGGQAAPPPPPPAALPPGP